MLGIAGSFVGELQAGFPILILVLGAPIIEEAFKPIGVFLGMVRWPYAMRNRLYVAILCAVSGAVFGLVESALYVFAFAGDAPGWYSAFRFTVPVAMHTICSFIVGLGLTVGVVNWVNHGDPLPRRSRNCYFTAVAIHGTYNAFAVILSLAGLFD